MGLNREDAYNLAKQISKYYQVPSSEKVLIQDPPIKKIIKEKRIVEKSDEETSGQRRLPMFVLWIILVVGWIIGIILMVSEIIAGGLVVGITASIVFAILLAINKKPVEEVEEYYDKEVEVTPEPRYEEKIVPNTKRIRALGRISLDFLAIPAHNGTILLDPYGLYSPRDLVLIEPDDKSEIFGIADTLEEITSQVPYVLKGENANFPVEQETTFGNSVILRGREKDLNEN